MVLIGSTASRDGWGWLTWRRGYPWNRQQLQRERDTSSAWSRHGRGNVFKLNCWIFWELFLLFLKLPPLLSIFISWVTNGRHPERQRYNWAKTASHKALFSACLSHLLPHKISFMGKWLTIILSPYIFALYVVLTKIGSFCPQPLSFKTISFFLSIT